MVSFQAKPCNRFAIYAELANMLQPGRNPLWETEAVFESRWKGPLVNMAIWNTHFYVNESRNERSGVDSCLPISNDAP